MAAMPEAPRLTPARLTARAARETRRAHALRENLRRRKEQVRAREADRPEPAAGGPAGDDPAA